jgi:hypothetical protein
MVHISENIAELFTQHLPSVSSTVAHAFACGLNTYLTSYKEIRDSAMNFEMLSEYKTRVYIMRFQKDQYWPYTPHFRKFMGLAIQELFKTELRSLGMDYISEEQTLVFVDTGKNRWIMRIESSDVDSEMNKIFMYFPLSNTSLGHMGKPSLIENLIDNTKMEEKSLGIITTVVDSWNLKNHD